MILVDTSVWVDHFRRGNDRLRSLLGEEQVLGHRFVVGELACGNLRNRREILTLLASLPQAPLAGHDEVLGFLESEKLHGKGVGWIDIHLLASARIARSPIWTLDQRLARTAVSFSIGYYGTNVTSTAPRMDTAGPVFGRPLRKGRTWPI